MKYQIEDVTLMTEAISSSETSVLHNLQFFEYEIEQRREPICVRYRKIYEPKPSFICFDANSGICRLGNDNFACNQKQFKLRKKIN
jgi:hypothetical protein